MSSEDSGPTNSVCHVVKDYGPRGFFVPSSRVLALEVSFCHAIKDSGPGGILRNVIKDSGPRVLFL